MLIKKKAYFLLFEILISFTLLSLCSLLLLRAPVLFFKKELTTLAKLEYERIADLTMCDIKTGLLQHTIDWDELPRQELTSLSPLTFAISRKQTLHLERQYQISQVEEVNTKEATHRLLKVLVFIKRKGDKKFSKYKYYARATLICEKDPSP